MDKLIKTINGESGATAEIIETIYESGTKSYSVRTKYNQWQEVVTADSLDEAERNANVSIDNLERLDAKPEKGEKK